MPRTKPRDDWYATPLYYDIVFAGDEEREADFLLGLARQHGLTSLRRKLRVLEPACGSGRLVLELARRGAAVTGFDASDAMLTFARERVRAAKLDAHLVQGRLERFDVGRGFDVAYCLVNTFKYLASERDAREHLRSVARALRPGGLYVVGIHLTQYEDRRRNRERWSARRGATHVVCNIQGWPADRRTRTERVRSRLVIRERGGERRSETHWTFRTYDWPQFRALIRAVPELELVATYDFGADLARPRTLPDELLDCLFVLRRR